MKQFFNYIIQCEKCGHINTGTQPYNPEVENQSKVREVVMRGKVSHPPICSNCGYINYGLLFKHFFTTKYKYWAITVILSMIILTTPLTVLVLSTDLMESGVIVILTVLSPFAFLALANYLFCAYHRKQFIKRHGLYERLPKNGILTEDQAEKIIKGPKPEALKKTKKQSRKDKMHIGYFTNQGNEPNEKKKISVECDYCDYWCEYEYDTNWKHYFQQTPKKPFWFQAKGHTGMVACGECGTIYCEDHSKDPNPMVCPECNSDLARKAIYEVLEKN